MKPRTTKMKRLGLYRCRVCPDVHAANDSMAGAWHHGYNDKDGRTVFYSMAKWWACGKEALLGPHASIEEALANPLCLLDERTNK